MGRGARDYDDTVYTSLCQVINFHAYMSFQHKPNYLVLLGHGSRDPEWAIPLQRLRQAVEQRMANARDNTNHSPEVLLAYWEFAQPSIPQVIEEIATQNAEVARKPVFTESPALTHLYSPVYADQKIGIDIVPVFIATGRHLREELPLMLKALQEQYPQTIIKQHLPLGEADKIIVAMADYVMGLF